MVSAISSILPWRRYFVSKQLFPKNPEILEHTYEVKSNLNEKVSIWKGDITKLKVDAIVNAANSSLLGGGGVDGPIHGAAGEQLRDECATLNGCRVGEAKITKGYNLPAKHVIHTVGTLDQDPEELARSYRNSLSLMLQHSLRTIAFPCISTGIFGYDPEQAAHVAIRETRQFLVENNEKVDRVIFCMYLESDLTIYEELMQRYFPVNDPPADYTVEDIENYIRNHPGEKVQYENILKKPATLISDLSQIS